jgi:hypothetical protein
MAKEAKTTRRVYKSELKRRTGWGDTWLRTKEKRGHIPAGRTDPGGKRKWWTDEEADQIVSGLPMASPRKVPAPIDLESQHTTCWLGP